MEKLRLFKFIVMRHADAEKSNYDHDFDRKITAYGKSQLVSCRERIVKIIPDKTLALVSSAKRTMQTFQGLKIEKLVTMQETEKLYEIELDDFYKFIRKVDLSNYNALLVVAHNPFVSDICTDLANFPVRMGTADICQLTVTTENFSQAFEMTGCWDVAAV